MNRDELIKAAKAAHQALVDQVYNPTFFDTFSKLYAPPRNEEEKQKILKLASLLLQTAHQRGYPVTVERIEPEVMVEAHRLVSQNQTVKTAALLLNKVES